MTEKTKKKTNLLTRKRAVVLTLLFLLVILSVMYVYRLSDQDQTNYNKRAIKTILEKYEQVKATELSEELYNQIVKIIEERKDCYLQETYSKRTAKCKRAFSSKIVQLARSNIKSAPMRGLFIRCVRESPIAGSLCSGEEGTTEQECLDTEVRAVEFCLDEYWRGGNFPAGENYTNNKKKKKK